MKVVLSQFEGVDNTPALPLAAGCLVASARLDPGLARTASFSISVARQPIDHALLAYYGADVLGFSLYPWNVAYSLAVARRAREALPGALVVAGGPSVPRRPDLARRFLQDNPWIDVIVFAEGELGFRALLAARARGAGFDGIRGIAYRLDPDECVLSDPPDRVYDLDETASPYLDGTFDELLAENPGRFTMALCETNRGCPFSCTFCDWSLTRHVVEFPIERVHAELDWIAGHGFAHMAIADANFGIRPRDADIARYLAERRRDTGLPSSCYFYLTKNDHRRNLETIEILRGAGIDCCVGLAVQDFDDGVLEAVERDNIQTGESTKLLEICGGRSIPTHNELILGLPGQTCESFSTTVVRAMPSYPRHDFVIYLCRLLDNTELAAQREKLGLETRRCVWKTSNPGFDAVVDESQEIVVGTSDMPVAEWQRAFRFAFFASATYNLRLLRVVLHHLAESCGVDLREYMGLLCDRTEDAAPGTVFADLGAVLDRYLASILSGGPFVLPIAGVAAPVEVADALAIAALARADAFFEEAERHTAPFAANGALAEAFRVQRLVTPRLGQAAPVEVGLEHDWPAYLDAGGTGAGLLRHPTRVRFSPPPYVTAPDFAAYATTHIACLRAHVGVGDLETLRGVDG